MMGLEDAMQATLDANGEFVKTNLIREVVLEMLGEFKKELAKQQKDMKTQAHVVRDHTNKFKTVDTDIKAITEKLKELGDIRAQISTINKTVSKLDKNAKIQHDEKDLMNAKTEAKLKVIGDIKNELKMFRKEKT